MGVMLLVTALIGIPIVEIAVFIEVGGRIGVWPTVGLIVLTAAIGLGLLRHQGLGVLGRANAAQERGELPIDEVFDGLCLLVAGALLLTPGFVTDTLGLLLFAPPLRAALRRALGRHLARSGRFRVWGVRSARPGEDAGGIVIEGEAEEVTPSRDDAGRRLPEP